MSETSYDHIITGMGCAGLSLAVQMSAAGLTKGKKILLIDREKKNRNDRTWCFWEVAPGPFEPIVFRKWSKAQFHSSSHSALLDLSPYSYKMIRGIDFFSYCLDIIQQDPAFEIRYEQVDEIGNKNGQAYCVAGDQTYRSDFLFNSILFEKPTISKGEYYLLQHFKGWVVRSADPVFDTEQATLMDFRPSQKHGTTFVYVMPFSPTEALIEYTLFTSDLLNDEDYHEGLSNYINNVLGLKNWTIGEEEFGIIPMTNHRFKRRNGSILNIGTAGGRTKASSGYTFRFIQKDTAAIINSMRKSGSPFSDTYSYSRFDWYDSVLLNILTHKTLAGDKIFTDLFKNNSSDRILKFLDNETSVSEELGILSSLPQLPFMKAGISEIVKKVIS
ncbi:MAG TPA: lycopene cyclase family protein [Chitinophagaceae bacterium]|nr:lycopene cyclase family protein [Chitinophagaceae bacterium]